MGDASKIGIHCPTGDFSDCGDPPTHHVPAGCEGVLIFEEEESTTCGLYCKEGKEPRHNHCADHAKCGWTTYTRLYDDLI